MNHAAISILMAQINPIMGAIEKNAQKIKAIISSSTEEIILFPELVLLGYPPEDLLLRPECLERVSQSLQDIARAVGEQYVVLGHPIMLESKLYNAASLIHQGQILGTYLKHHLPNYGVFDEKRYFHSSPIHPFIFEVKGKRFGLCICEDLWAEGPVDALIQAKADVILCLNASPFEKDKMDSRLKVLKSYATRGVDLCYVNLWGAQDELVFDGCSCVVNQQGDIVAKAPAFEEALMRVDIQGKNIQGTIAPAQSKQALIYQAICCAIREYVSKNGFKKVLLGLSGGIDSALTLCLAVDAIGAENVHAVFMPSRYTATMSDADAMIQAKAMGVEYSRIPIESAFNCFLDLLNPHFQGQSPDLTEENLQARIRGVLLMAFSNKFGAMLLCTSNKSETAVGYSTLYGDMAGAYAPLKDVLKTEVYELAQYRNSIAPVIPLRVITRPPSAELAPNQKDQDSLPPYEILDAIIRAYMVEKRSALDLIQQGYEQPVVEKVLQLIQRNEYKRHQSPPGVKVSEVAFGPDWRYPLTNQF